MRRETHARAQIDYWQAPRIGFFWPHSVTYLSLDRTLRLPASQHIHSSGPTPAAVSFTWLKTELSSADVLSSNSEKYCQREARGTSYP